MKSMKCVSNQQLMSRPRRRGVGAARRSVLAAARLVRRRGGGGGRQRLERSAAARGGPQARAARLAARRRAAAARRRGGRERAGGRAGPPHARVPRGRAHRRVVALRRAGRRPRRRAVARRRLQAARRGGWCGCRVQARPRRPRRRRLVCGPALGSALVWSPRPGGGAPGVEPVGAGGGGRHGARLDAVRRAPPARLAPAERARRPGGRRGARDALSQRCTELLSEASAAAPSDKPPLLCAGG
mmetsp:Transcript_35385/g.114082  ORF Transcript_35385/g.114082 Transcript_35385/m.114082 type:complete len:243 (-) Transcript_35385:3-731(-)